MRRITPFQFLLIFLTLTFVQSDTQAQENVTHRFLTADSSKGLIAIIDADGNVAWKTKIGPLHDLHQLENGNLLFQTNWTTIVEVNPKTGETVWQYDSASSNGNQGKKVEVHAFQRLTNGNTMIAESGVSRIIEVDTDGKLRHQIPLQVSKSHPHKDTRLVRKLDTGNYLVCHEGDGKVKEYDSQGNVVWEYQVPLFGKKRAGGHGLNAFGNSCFSALRKENGNTLIATGNGHSVIEVTPEKKIVWKLTQNELKNIQLAWVTTLQLLPNGNLVIGNCHAGPKNPQIIEINQDKEVIWTFHDFKRFGNATTNTQILETNGKAIAAKLGTER